MKKRVIALIGMILMTSMVVGCGKKAVENNSSKNKKTVVNLTTDEDKEEKVSEELKVAVGTVAAAEILDMLEVDLVGVPTSSRELPKRYTESAKVGMPMKPDMEILKSVEPDLFITDINFKESLEKQLTEQGIKTEFISNNSYEDVLNNIEEFGDRFNKTEKAEAIISDFNTRSEAALKKGEGKEKQKVMILFGTPESFMMATDKSFVGNIVNMMGAENVTSSMDKVFAPFVPFSIEQAISFNPDVILRLTHASPEVSRKMFEAEFSENKVWQSLDAVKNERVYDLDNTCFGVTANIKAIDAIEQMAEMLYGE